MATVSQHEPQWLQQLLERAVAENWCTQLNCSTCACEQIRMTLGLLEKSSGHPRFIPMTPENADTIIVGLTGLSPLGAVSHQFEEATRWVLYEVWRNFGNQYFSRLDGTWAGTVLARMRAHHQNRQEARRIHAARQGVKQRDWKD